MTYGESLRELLREGLSTGEIMDVLRTTHANSRPLHIRVKKVKRQPADSCQYDAPVTDVHCLTNKAMGYRLVRGFNLMFGSEK